MGLRSFDWMDMQSVLALTAMGPDCVREFLQCRSEKDVAEHTMKWFGRESPTIGDVREVALAKMAELEGRG